jgi:hypothetical protein
MVLMVRRRWFWAAFAGGLAFLAWQPLVFYPAAAVAGAALMSPRGERLRRIAQALAGSAIPIAATTLWFWLQGALGAFVEAAITFPFSGISRGHDSLASRVARIVDTVDGSYTRMRIPFWAGLVALLVLLAVRLRRTGPRGVLTDPYAIAVAGTLLALAGFSLTDFQGYPDLYPLLPYAALGLGGALALGVRAAARVRLRVPAAAAAILAVAALGAASWSWYGRDAAYRPSLAGERASAAEVVRLAGPGRTPYAVGDPTVLVLTGRRNPSRYIYLGSGVEEWMLARTPHGFKGWKLRLLAHPGPVTLAGWSGSNAMRLSAWLHLRRVARKVGRYEVFLP